MLSNINIQSCLIISAQPVYSFRQKEQFVVINVTDLLEKQNKTNVVFTGKKRVEERDDTRKEREERNMTQ